MTTAADLHGSYLARAAVGVTLVAHPAVATT
jgi:hypothetical protein